MENSIAPHETFELHELLVFKSVCATKAKAMTAFTKDEELKSILQEDFAASQKQIKELRGLLQHSVYAPAEITGAPSDKSTTAGH